MITRLLPNYTARREPLQQCFLKTMLWVSTEGWVCSPHSALRKISFVKWVNNLFSHIWQSSFRRALQGLWRIQMGPLHCQPFLQNCEVPTYTVSNEVLLDGSDRSSVFELIGWQRGKWLCSLLEHSLFQEAYLKHWKEQISELFWLLPICVFSDSFILLTFAENTAVFPDCTTGIYLHFLIRTSSLLLYIKYLQSLGSQTFLSQIYTRQSKAFSKEVR